MSIFGITIFTSTVAAAIIIVAVSSSLSVTGFLVILKYLPSWRTEHNNEVNKVIFGIVSSLYAILLAFVVVIIWQEFTNAESETQTEVTRVSNLIRNAGVFPEPQRRDLRLALINYADVVANKEWNDLAKGNTNGEATQAYAQIWNNFYNLTPKGDRQKIFFSASVDRLNELAQARRLRVLNSQAKVPTPLWILIIAGGMVTVGFTWFFATKSTRAQGIAIGSLGALLGFVFFLIYALEHPFAGDVRISPSPFKQLVNEWRTQPL